MNYNYKEFLNDSSDDYPKYYPQEVDDWWYRNTYSNPMNDPIDHIEETERNKLLGQDEQLSEEEFISAFREVVRLAKCAVQPWWTEEYKAKSESKIDLIEEYLKNLKKKA